MTKEAEPTAEDPRAVMRAERTITTQEGAQATGEQPDAAAAEEPTGEGETSTSSDSAPDDRDNQPGKNARRKIRKLSRKLSDAEARAQAYEEQAKAYEAELAELRKLKQEAPKPKRDEFEDEDQWAEALVQWKQSKAKEPPKPKAPPASPSKGLTAEEVQDFQQAGAAAMGEQWPDPVKAQDVKITPRMAEWLIDNEAHDIYVELVNNPDKAEAIAQADFDQDFGEMYRALEQAKAKRPRKGNGQFARKPKNQTSAPAPTPAPAAGKTAKDPDAAVRDKKILTHEDLNERMLARKKREADKRRLG